MRTSLRCAALDLVLALALALELALALALLLSLLPALFLALVLVSTLLVLTRPDAGSQSAAARAQRVSRRPTVVNVKTALF